MTTGPLTDSTTAVKAILEAAGIRVTTNPKSLTPPCVIIVPRATTRRTSSATDVEVAILCVAPGPANLDAMGELDRLAARAVAAMDTSGLPIRTGRVQTMTSGPATDPLLTYELTAYIEA